MLSLHDKPNRLCDGISRRELMRIGGLNLLGLSLPMLLKAQAQASPTAVKDPMFGRAKNIIFLWMQGGPPQHSTWDPKPDAPLEIRGPFKPISTNVPGVQICELLPRIARIADKLAIVRSMSTDENTHENSGYWVMTGYRNPSGIAREIKPTDWPYFGSIVKMLKPSTIVPALSTVWIPDLLRLNDNVRPGGQTGGFMGSQWDPDYFVGDPLDKDYRIEGLGLQPEISPLRLNNRFSLLDQVGRHLSHVERSGAIDNYDEIRQAAFGLLTSGKAREAFAVGKEPDKVRERYGKNRWGQCVLLARRLIEAGVRMVHVNWPRDPGDSAVDNPLWDTHTQEADRMQDALCPQFDVGFTALMEDLDQRGLLDETLVVCIGEFGRTPKINVDGGRDHWGHVFSFALAGAGISGGQVYGTSDRTGGYPASNRVQPPDLTATIFHLLGIGHNTTFPDRQGRPLHVTTGEPLYQLLGTKPATMARTAAGGDIRMVPPFQDGTLWNNGFEDAVPLRPHGVGPTIKGWHASPIAGDASLFGVRLIDDPALSRSGARHAAIGFRQEAGKTLPKVASGTKLMLSQEARSPRAGTYTFAINACGRAHSAEFFRDVFSKNFICRLVVFGFLDLEKDHREQRQFASYEFSPNWCEPGGARYDRFEVSVRLRSQDDNAREIAKGIGIAVIVEKISPGLLDLGSLNVGDHAHVAIEDAELLFDPRARDDKIKI